MSKSIDKKTEALKLALEALEVATTPLAKDRQEVLRAQAAIREALAEQPAQQQSAERVEPVAVARVDDLERGGRVRALAMGLSLDAPLYTSPPAAQQQEPVAVVSGYYGGQCVVLPTNPARVFNNGTAFYTSPPASKPWVGLTDEQIEEIAARTLFPVNFARAIEARLKELNT